MESDFGVSRPSLPRHIHTDPQNKSMQYQPTPRHGNGSTPFSSSSSRTSTSRVGVSIPSVTLPSAFTRVFKRGPPDEDDDLAAAKGEIEKLEEKWGGLAVSVGKVGSARRGEYEYSSPCF